MQNIKLQTTAEVIADKIRQDIVVGEYLEGQPLRQDELARRFNVSKIPLREALYQLKSEGLVEFQNNRGSLVSSLSPARVEEIYLMRIALEEIALKRAIPNLTPSDIVNAESALKLIELTDQPVKWSQLNWQFHAAIYRAANMPTLLNTIATLHNNVARYLLLYLKKLGFHNVSQDEHWQLLALCKMGRTQQATGLLHQHLNDALSQTLEYMGDKNGSTG